MDDMRDSSKNIPSDTETPPATEENELEEQNRKTVQEALPYSRSMHCGKGEQVIFEGAESQSFFYVESGALEVSYTAEETNILVAIIGAGSFFGEIGFFDGISRVRNIRATEDSEIRAFDQKGMERLLTEDPRLYGKFLTFLACSICAKFRRVLDEREPLTAYAASLSTGGRSYWESEPLPRHFFQTSHWQSVNKTMEELKAHLYNLSHILQQDSRPEIPKELEQECHEVLDTFNTTLQHFQGSIKESKDEHFVWGYVFKEIFPYFMRSRFAERTYYKPKGYAGDFLMMEMIYRNEPEGDGKLGILVDGWLLATAAAQAVRGRRELLSRLLASLTRPKIDAGKPIQIMNLACGLSRELFDFLSQCDHTELIEAICVDIDSEALQYANHNVNVFSHRAAVRLMNENIVKWSLGRVRHDFGRQDIIYSSGLTDYLEPRLFLALIERCYEHLKPGGVLVIGNFSPANPNRIMMDHVLYWKLIHRDENELKELFAASAFGDEVEVLSEQQGVNLFAVARKTG